jgi:hypothetical protein
MSKGIRIIACGGRDFDDCVTIRRALFALHEGPRGPITLLIHGNARGADTEAGRWARDFNIPCGAVPAEWAKYGKRAGPIRNKAMLGQHIDLVLAFPGGSGTADMKRQARRAGVEVIEVAP